MRLGPATPGERFLKTLILVRHGKSSWDSAVTGDFERPLAGRGLRDAPRMARRLIRRGRLPQVFVSSPAKRALQTAMIFAEEMGQSPERVIEEPRIYEASAQTLLEIVQQQHDSWDCVMLVGHNPGFTQLAQQLADKAPANIPTCGCLELAMPINSWQLARPGLKTEIWFDYPKNASPS